MSGRAVVGARGFELQGAVEHLVPSGVAALIGVAIGVGIVALSGAAALGDVLAAKRAGHVR